MLINFGKFKEFLLLSWEAETTDMICHHLFQYKVVEIKMSLEINWFNSQLETSITKLPKYSPQRIPQTVPKNTKKAVTQSSVFH